MSFLLNEKFASKVVYGLVAVMALLVVLELHPPSALSAIITLYITTLAIALAEAYSEAVASMLTLKRRPTASELKHLWQEVTPIISSSQPAVIILLAALVGVISVEVALQLAQAAVIVLLFLYGLRIGQFLHATLPRQIVTGLFMASAGLIVVLLKVVIH